MLKMDRNMRKYMNKRLKDILKKQDKSIVYCKKTMDKLYNLKNSYKIVNIMCINYKLIYL